MLYYCNTVVRLRPVWMTNHPPSVLWHWWLGHQTCKNRRPYNLYCVVQTLNPAQSINQSINHWLTGYYDIETACQRLYSRTIPLTRPRSIECMLDAYLDARPFVTYGHTPPLCFATQTPSCRKEIARRLFMFNSLRINTAVFAL